MVGKLIPDCCSVAEKTPVKVLSTEINWPSSSDFTFELHEGVMQVATTTVPIFWVFWWWHWRLTVSILLLLFFLVSEASSSASTAVIAKTSSLNTGPIESSLMVLWFTSASCSSPSCRSGRWQNAATAARGLRLLKFDVWAPSCCTAAPLIVCVLVPFLCLLFTLIYIPPCMSEPVFYSVEFGF